VLLRMDDTLCTEPAKAAAQVAIDLDTQTVTSNARAAQAEDVAASVVPAYDVLL
jgi:hypothetical protein